jgi:hypothetical protein
MISTDNIEVKRPHVTEVLSHWTDFSKIPADVLDHASKRGSRVHAICAALARGEWIAKILPEDAGYVESFKWWLLNVVEKVHIVERRFEDKALGYQGKPDLVVTIKGDSVMTLVDLKTPVQAGKTWAAQLTAYRNLLHRNCFNLDLHGMKTGSLRLSPEGKPPKMTYYENDQRDLAGFLAALQCHKYFNL